MEKFDMSHLDYYPARGRPNRWDLGRYQFVEDERKEADKMTLDELKIRFNATVDALKRQFHIWEDEDYE